MTIAQKRATSPKFENKFLSGLQKQLPELIPPAIALFIFLVIWQVFSWTPGATLPGPIQVIQDTRILILYPFYDKGGTDKGLFWQIWASLQRVAISYTLAAIVGIALGVLIGVNKTMSKALDPLFQLLRTVPPLAWVPISLAALRQNEPAALFVIFITAIWPILINTAVGVTQIPQDYNRLLHSRSHSRCPQKNRSLKRPFLPFSRSHTLYGNELGKALPSFYQRQSLLIAFPVGDWERDIKKFKTQNLKCKTVT